MIIFQPLQNKPNQGPDVYLLEGEGKGTCLLCVCAGECVCAGFMLFYSCHVRIRFPNNNGRVGFWVGIFFFGFVFVSFSRKGKDKENS